MWAAQDSVFIFGVNESECRSLADELEAGYSVGDVRNEAAVKCGVAECLDRFGRIDALMNVAGISARSLGDGPLHQCTSEAWDAGSKPLKTYLGRFVREKDVKLFLEITHSPVPHKAEELELQVLAPAYILSEMRAGFQIGAVIFLPFLLIDIVVASVTLSIGMVQLPPAMVSAPFKVLLFVLVDGWNLTVGSLMKGLY